MKRFRFYSIVVGLPLWILAGAQGASVRAAPAPHHVAPKAPAAKQATGVVEPEAVAALHRMSAYLTSLNTAAIVATGSLDVVTDDGQRLQLDGVTTYKVRKPNGFVIDYNSDMKKRRFLYDGKTFTI